MHTDVKAPKRSASVLQPEQVEVKKKPSSSAVEVRFITEDNFKSHFLKKKFLLLIFCS